MDKKIVFSEGEEGELIEGVVYGVNEIVLLF